MTRHSYNSGQLSGALEFPEALFYMRQWERGVYTDPIRVGGCEVGEAVVDEPRRFRSNPRIVEVVSRAGRQDLHANAGRIHERESLAHVLSLVCPRNARQHGSLVKARHERVQRRRLVVRMNVDDPAGQGLLPLPRLSRKHRADAGKIPSMLKND